MVVVTHNPEAEPMLLLDEPPGIQENAGHKNPITREAYKNITSSMRAESLSIDSPKTALELLTTAIQLQNMPLVNECIKNLDEHLDKENVLMIYAHLSKCKMPLLNTKNEFEPSAPPIMENENQRGTDWVHELINNLRHNCLLVIDNEADYVLRQRELIDLNYTDIYNILCRDTLRVSNEMLVYTAMYNWGQTECTRMTLTTLHLQEVLRQLRYTPRYGLMTRKEFLSKNIGLIKGPTKSGALEEKEWRLIKFYINQRAKHKSVNELDHKMSKSRTHGLASNPKILSCKSSSRHETNSLSSSQTSYQTKQKCEKCLINFLACWTAIFD